MSIRSRTKHSCACSPALRCCWRSAAACASPRPALRIGTNVWIGSEPLYLARELGQLDPATVQLVEYPSASEVLRAFRNQAIDGMVISLDELFGLAVDGLQPRIILVVDVSHGADVVVGRPGMRTMRDLKGKSVAVESGALGAFVLSRALALNGMQASDVNVVHLESNEQPSAFEKGQVDGAVTFDPYRTQLLQGRRHDAVRQHPDPGEIVDLLAVRASVAREAAQGDPGAARRLVRRARLHEARPEGCGAADGHPPADDRRAVPRGAAGPARSVARGEPAGCSAARRRSWRSPDAG